MPLVTLIGERLAHKGKEFLYLGPNNNCRNCRLKTVCFNLKVGREYQITKIRDKRHGCNIHEGNTAVIEVQEMPIFAAVDKKIREGQTSKIEKFKCKNIGCVYYELCTNKAIQKDKKYKIIKIHDDMDCALGYQLNKAELTD